MKKIDYGGKQVTILSHREKARELHISTRTLSRWKKKGKLKDILISVPKFRRFFYLSVPQEVNENIATL